MPSQRKSIQYRVAGLPNALRLHRPGPDTPIALLRRAYRRFYWRPQSPQQRRALLLALVIWPVLFCQSAASALGSNGGRVAASTGKSRVRQLAEMAGHYARSGILPQWYYIFSLHDPGGRQRASAYLNRFETKFGIYDILKTGPSPLTDKQAFAEHCRATGVRTVPVLLTVDNERIECTGDAPALPDIDLFFKPLAGRGGTGAERWDSVGGNRFRSPCGTERSGEQLLNHLIEASQSTAMMVQPRLSNHPDIADLSNGALCTVRVLTCLDENGEPEPQAAAYRMAIGTNVTVDNLHAGGIAAAADIATGRLSKASDLGRKRSVGWLSHHPQTGAAIEGRVLPLWPEILALVRQAHSAFPQRVVVGWDVAILADGPVIVEGNARPDLDIIQRTLGRGLGVERTAELLAHHVRLRMPDV